MYWSELCLWLHWQAGKHTIKKGTDWACVWEMVTGCSCVLALNTSRGRILNLGATRCLLYDMIVCLTKPLCDFHLFSPRTSYQGHFHAKAGVCWQRTQRVWGQVALKNHACSSPESSPLCIIALSKNFLQLHQKLLDHTTLFVELTFKFQKKVKHQFQNETLVL